MSKIGPQSNCWKKQEHVYIQRALKIELHFCGKIIEQAICFTYLGGNLTSDNTIGSELDSMKVNVYSAFHKLMHSVFSRKDFSIALKVSLQHQYYPCVTLQECVLDFEKGSVRYPSCHQEGHDQMHLWKLLPRKKKEYLAPRDSKLTAHCSEFSQK